MTHWPRVTGTLEERFWRRVRKTDYCWEWTAFKMPNGYGQFGRELASVHSQLAHRWAWEFGNKQPVPEGMFVLHKCDNPGCVRPEHLFLGTDLENHRDKARKGRHHNTLKTHCPKGHEYTPENTLHKPSPSGGLSRKCRTCINERKRLRALMQ